MVITSPLLDGTSTTGMSPDPKAPYGKSLLKPYITRVFICIYGYNPQESLENTS